jgi:hypothetical protein
LLYGDALPVSLALLIVYTKHDRAGMIANDCGLVETGIASIIDAMSLSELINLSNE